MGWLIAFIAITGGGFWAAFFFGKLNEPLKELLESAGMTREQEKLQND